MRQRSAGLETPHEEGGAGTGWMGIDKTLETGIAQNPGCFRRTGSWNNLPIPKTIQRELQSQGAAARGWWPELSQLGVLGSAIHSTRESWNGLVGRHLPAPLCPTGRDTFLGAQLPWASCSSASLWKLGEHRLPFLLGSIELLGIQNGFMPSIPANLHFFPMGTSSWGIKSLLGKERWQRSEKRY